MLGNVDPSGSFPSVAESGPPIQKLNSSKEYLGTIAKKKKSEGLDTEIGTQSPPVS